LARHPLSALFVAADRDKIAPTSEVEQLHAQAAPGSRLVIVPNNTHETVTYQFADLAPPILEWLSEAGKR